MARVVRIFLIAIAALAVAPPEGFAESARDDTDKQLAAMQKRAEQGYVVDAMKLGKAYLTGNGAPQNFEESARWFKRAAGLGNPEAQNMLGYFYRRGIGVKVEDERALHWFQMASAGGLPAAKVNLGIMYLRGDGVHQSYSRARDYFERAVEKGSGLGAAYLGDMEFLGLGCPRNSVAAEKWYARGTKLRDPVATYDLAYLYSLAPDHAHNFTKAIRLLRSAIRRGFVPAKHALGFLLLNHPELEPVGGDARKLLEEASNGGVWRASAILAILARDGRSKPAGPAEAYFYFHLAVQQGGAEVRDRLRPELSRLAAKLSKEERESAEDRAEDLNRRQQAVLVYQADDQGTRVTVNASAALDSDPPGE
ncbi:MAG: tetratricopeptide repeat protein [Acidobacteriota bacterium]